jgi:GNAT superfamily N-acetyltransferase
MNYRRAAAADCAHLAVLNHRLIADEGHRNRMTVVELEERMRGWLARDYVAILFDDGEEAAYALYREQPEEIYLRQLYVLPERRRQGIGRQALALLRTEIWPRTKRLTVDVLTGNQPALSFWRAVGYRDYCLTLELLPPEEDLPDVAARGPRAAGHLPSLPPGPNDSSNP